MRHLFIVNPASSGVKEKVPNIKRQIRSFFQDRPALRYDIYVTKWCRDASSYIRSYIIDMYGAGDFDELRIHSIGGSGTLYEIINAVIGFQNVSVAAYPYGHNSSTVRYFGADKLFASIETQVFSPSVPVDVMRCGTNIGINASYIGFIAKAHMNYSLSSGSGGLFKPSFALSLYRSSIQYPSHSFFVELDGKRLDGEYRTVSVANMSMLGKRYRPAPHARPDDGLLDVYLTKELNIRERVFYFGSYLSGRHYRIPHDKLLHYSGKRITVSCAESTSMCLDGENFTGDLFDYEIVESAINIVCPDGISLDALAENQKRRLCK